MKKPEEKKLLRLFEALSAEQQDTVLAFVEFLAARNPVAVTEVQAPLPIPRPAEESVVKAIKRLRETYPMLNPDKLLHETSGFMMKHIMQGQPAAEVINELEALFLRHYQRHKSGE